MHNQLQPRIDHIMDGIDEAAALLEATPEYQVFTERPHLLAQVLQEAGDLLGHKESGGRVAPASFVWHRWIFESITLPLVNFRVGNLHYSEFPHTGTKAGRGFRVQ